MQTTLIILKPDAVQRGLIGRIITRFEEKGLKILAAKLIRISQELAAQHYREHHSKPFYEQLIRYITSQPVLILALRGYRAVEVCRKMIGSTRGTDAQPGTIRGDFCVSNTYNLVHASDSPDSAARELALFFHENDLLQYDRTADLWGYSESELQHQAKLPAQPARV